MIKKTKTLLTLLLAYFLTNNLWAATITVTNANDSGAGSLRQAVTDANDDDEIVFDASLANQTITLTSGQIEINHNLILNGEAATELKISGNNASRIFYINSNKTVTIQNISLIEGRATANGSIEAWGGAIMAASKITLSLDNITFTNNVADAGGALVIGGQNTATINNCEFTNNDGSLVPSLGRGGGAIIVRSGCHFTITNSQFLNNKGSNGGAINSILSTLIVEGCYFEGNDCSSGVQFDNVEAAGGAIFTDGASKHDDPEVGYLTIRNSVFINNKAIREGGALFLWTYRNHSPNDRTIVENVTCIGNEVLPDPRDNNIAVGGAIRIGSNEFEVKNSLFSENKGQRGGAIWTDPRSPGTITNVTFHKNTVIQFGGAVFLNAETTINNCTFSQNHTSGTSAAIHQADSRPTINVYNSIIHNNTNDEDKEYEKQSNRPITGSNNIQYPNPNGGVEVVAGITITDPLLDSLADNEGPTQTMALKEGSPAIDAGAANCFERDQRNAERVGTCDIGAYEFGGVTDNSIIPPTPIIPDSLPESIIEAIEAYNILTPNGDGQNDTWQIDNLSGDYIVKIFTKTGQVVFETDDYSINTWNGTKGEQELPEGTYYYVISFKSLNEVKTGYITLIK